MPAPQSGPEGLVSVVLSDLVTQASEEQVQDSTLLCRSWARTLCFRMRGIAGGAEHEGHEARVPRRAPKAPRATRCTWVGPTLPRMRRDL